MGREHELISSLREHGLKISSAESLTGGMVAATIVSVPGASNAFMEGFVTYDIGAKQRTLGISEDVLDKEGAVSPVTASLMAENAAKKANTDMAVATTGNAGPDSSEGKAVGLVYTAVYFNGKTDVFEHHFNGDRASIRKMTCDIVIEEAYNKLKKVFGA